MNFYTLISKNNFKGKYGEIAQGIIIEKQSKFLSFLFKIDNENQAQEKIELIKKDNVDMIAIGNGTASRESESFVASLIKKADKNNIEVIINIDTNLTAPVYENSEIGNLYILCNGEEVFTTNILSLTYIPKKNISNYYLDFFKNYSSLLNEFSI